MKPVKCIPGPLVYTSNYTIDIQYTFIAEAAQTNVPNSLAMLEALPYFEGRSLILAPNIR